MAKLAAQYPLMTEGAIGLWGRNALQTITIARHFPRNPQQAIGFRGIVDYTSGQRTTDLTLDTILTEDTEEAVEGATGLGTSVYRHAENQMNVGHEQYVLTSCNVGFTAGNPATASYGYITAGEGAAMEAVAGAVEILKDGEEAYFAVVLGDDGSGIRLLTKSAGAWTTNSEVVLPSGVQNVTFNSTINKNNILDVRSAQPVYFVTTYPINIAVNLETYDKSSTDGGFNASGLTNLGVCLAGLGNHADRSNYDDPSRNTPGADPDVNADPLANYPASTRKLVLATGLVKTEDSERMNVGGFMTYTYAFTAADIAIPLKYYELQA